VTNLLTGFKVAGYVGCQTARPFAATESGGQYDTYEQPEFRGNFAKACGAEPVAFGMEASKDAGLDHNMIAPVKLVELAKKKNA
jgi:heterodisulfide reductase subunit B